MLNNFRSFSGSVLVKLLLVLLVLSFALWGVGDMLRQSGQGGAIATVGGEKISADQYMRSLRMESENFRQILGAQYSQEMLDSLQLPEKILQQMVQQKMLKVESKSIGLIPSDEQILKAISQNQAFLGDDGKFSKQRFDMILKRSGNTEKKYVDMLRGDISAEQLSLMFKAPLPRQEAAIRTLYLSQNTRRTAKLYTLSPSAIKSLPAPTQEQLEEFYKSHSAKYSVPEYRTLSYLTISTKDAGKEENAYNDLINAIEDAFAGGSTLAEVAKEFQLPVKTIGAVDREGKSQGGQPQSIPSYDKFLDVAFRVDEGSESQLISMKGGDFYVVRVDKLTPEHLRPLAQVKDKVVEGWKVQEAIKQLQTLASDIATQFLAPEKRGALIAQHGLKVSNTGELKRDGGYDNIPPLLLNDIFTHTVGSSTKSYPVKDGFAFAVVDSIIPANLAEKGSEKYYAATAPIHNQLTKTYENELFDQYLMYLERELSVDVNTDMLKAVKKE